MSTQFPFGFRWGVADADLQVIGEHHTIAEEQSVPTMWGQLALQGKTYHSQTPGQGVDRYHYFEQDAELLSSLGVSHYRTSVSMARIIQRDGQPNRKAIDWYRQYFEMIRDKGISLCVTLYHWELPYYIHQMGGWASDAAVDLYELHTKVVCETLDDLISEYHLINEHNCIALYGYFQGIRAPFEKDLKTALTAAHKLLLAQGKGFRILKNMGSQAKISTVNNCMPVYSNSLEEDDIYARQLHEEYIRDWFLEPMFRGRYPARLAYLLKDYMPTVNDGDFDIIKIGAELDSLGINYYMGQTVEASQESQIGTVLVDTKKSPRNGLGWPIYLQPFYPNALYDLLSQLYSRYQPFGLRSLFIAENGMALSSTVNQDGTINDQTRIDYLQGHLQQIHDAILAGIPVNGYFLWTLLDNYEWCEGYRKDSAFGLVHVERDSMLRTPKSSFFWYKDLIQSNAMVIA